MAETGVSDGDLNTAPKLSLIYHAAGNTDHQSDKFGAAISRLGTSALLTLNRFYNTLLLPLRLFMYNIHL